MDIPTPTLKEIVVINRDTGKIAGSYFKDDRGNDFYRLVDGTFVVIQPLKK